MTIEELIALNDGKEGTWTLSKILSSILGKERTISYANSITSCIEVFETLDSEQ